MAFRLRLPGGAVNHVRQACPRAVVTFRAEMEKARWSGHRAFAANAERKHRQVKRRGHERNGDPRGADCREALA